MILTIATGWVAYTLRSLRRTPRRAPHRSGGLRSLLPSSCLAPALALLTAAACGGSDSITPPTPGPASLQVVAGADQRGYALDPLPEDIGVQVLDDDGHTMSGMKVTLAVVDGDGTLSAQEATSDALGTVHASWTLGPRTGAQHLRASVADAPSVQTTVTATASPQLLASMEGNTIMLLYLENGAIRPLSTLWAATHPVWSPDGRQIALVGRPDNSINDRVYVMNADGSDATPITTVDGSTSDLDVDWSPDGKHLAFTRLTDSVSRIFTMDPDGKNVAQLTSVQSSMPRWSPDGERIAFSMKSAIHAFSEIAVMNADGSGIRTLTANDTDDEGPDWSPDGTRLVYYGWREGRPRLFVINADGTGDRLLTTDVPPDHIYDDDPAWSGDGSVIAFSRAVGDLSGGTFSSALYTIRPDGTGLTVVSPGPEALFGARWRP